SARAQFDAGGGEPGEPVVMLNITSLSGGSPLPVTANTAGSSAPGGTIASPTIDFGDGSPIVNAASASHTYSATGIYAVTATVTDNHGATATKAVSVTVGSHTVNLSF